MDRIWVVDLEWTRDNPNRVTEVGLALVTLNDEVPIAARPEPYSLKTETLKWWQIVEVLRNMVGPEDFWGSWGSEDRKRMETECWFYKTSNPLSGLYLDIQGMFSVLMQRRHLGLADAIHELGMRFHGVPHEGGDDAYNAARILAELLRRFRD